MGKDRKHKFWFHKSKPGPSTSGGDPTSGPGSGSSQSSVASIQTQSASTGRSWRDRLPRLSRSLSPALPRPVVPMPTGTSAGTASVPPVPHLGLAHDKSHRPSPAPPSPQFSAGPELTGAPSTSPETASTIPAPDPGTAPPAIIIRAPEFSSEPMFYDQPVASTPQTLWQKALDRIPQEDKIGLDLNPGDLLRNLIDATQETKREIESKQWVYQNKDGETVSYAERFLTLLNKYVGIVDIAIQHDPHVVALVWSGFRFLLQVCPSMTYPCAVVFAYSYLFQRSRLRIWRTYK